MKKQVYAFAVIVSMVSSIEAGPVFAGEKKAFMVAATTLVCGIQGYQAGKFKKAKVIRGVSGGTLGAALSSALVTYLELAAGVWRFRNNQDGFLVPGTNTKKLGNWKFHEMTLQYLRDMQKDLVKAADKDGLYVLPSEFKELSTRWKRGRYAPQGPGEKVYPLISITRELRDEEAELSHIRKHWGRYRGIFIRFSAGLLKFPVTMLETMFNAPEFFDELSVYMKRLSLMHDIISGSIEFAREQEAYESQRALQVRGVPQARLRQSLRL